MTTELEMHFVFFSISKFSSQSQLSIVEARRENKIWRTNKRDVEEKNIKQLLLFYFNIKLFYKNSSLAKYKWRSVKNTHIHILFSWVPQGKTNKIYVLLVENVWIDTFLNISPTFLGSDLVRMVLTSHQ